MNTIIVPVDFSETSLHAAHYAAKLFAGREGVSILLYHSYSKESEHAESQKNLEDLKAKLQQEQQLSIDVLAHHESDFVAGLERAARHRGADLVVMGVTGRSAIAQVFIGSNTLKFSDTKACPVLIVPEKAVFREIKNVMLASDFKDTLNRTPSVPIKRFLKNFDPQLHVVNVDPEHYIAITDAYENEKQQLRAMFEELDPEFYFIRLFDVEEALTMFSEEKNIDLIVSIHHNHTFFKKLFKRSQTKNLTYHSNVAVLVVHE